MLHPVVLDSFEFALPLSLSLPLSFVESLFRDLIRIISTQTTPTRKQIFLCPSFAIRAARRGNGERKRQNRSDENWWKRRRKRRISFESIPLSLSLYIYFYDGTRSIFELRISALVSEQSHSSQDRFVNLIFHPVFLALLSLSLSFCLSLFLHLLHRERERGRVSSSSSILGSPPRPSIVPVGCFLRLSSSREHLSISFSRFPGALSRHLFSSPPSPPPPPRSAPPCPLTHEISRRFSDGRFIRR